jgi:hypothetical protein
MRTEQRLSKEMQKLVRVFSWFTRILPTDNKLLRGFVLSGSHVFDEYSFDFGFRCPRLGIKWSAASFPSQLTRHMMFDGAYQQDVLYWIESLCRRGDTVYDVGAFHGLMSIVASRAVGSHGRVVAFEPNSQSVGHLKRHLALNGCTRCLLRNERAYPAPDQDRHRRYGVLRIAGSRGINRKVPPYITWSSTPDPPRGLEHPSQHFWSTSLL